MLMNGYHWGSSRWESKQWRGAPDSTSRGLRRAEGCSLGEYHWVHNATKRGCDDSLGMKKGPVLLRSSPMERRGGLFPFHPQPFSGCRLDVSRLRESDDELELKDELEGDDGLRNSVVL